MKELETISPASVEDAKEYYRVFFRIPNAKIDEVLELLDFGRKLPEIWKEDLEDEIIGKIAKICNADRSKSSAVWRIIIDTLRKSSRRSFVRKRASDLKKLGFKKSDVEKYQRLASVLKEQKTETEIKKVDRWRRLSREVLPHLSLIEYSYDLRCDIDKNKVEEFVPMVLMKITTIAEEEAPEELVFQMDIGTLRQFSRDLSKIYRKARLLKEYGVKPVGSKK